MRAPSIASEPETDIPPDRTAPHAHPERFPFVPQTSCLRKPVAATKPGPIPRYGAKTRVIKLGGTSMANPSVVERAIEAAISSAGPTWFVVSALAEVTDALLGLAAESTRETPHEQLLNLRQRHLGYLDRLIRHPQPEAEVAIEAAFTVLDTLCSENRGTDPFKRAVLFSTGERLAAHLLLAAFADRSAVAEIVDPRHLLRASGSPLDADPDLEASRQQVASWLHGRAADAPRIVIVPGFYAAGPDGKLRLLGRGGSDTSATLLGAAFGPALDPRGVEIWTDVAGIYPSDPRLDPTLRPFPFLSYDQAEQLAIAGARVLHSKSLGPARTAGIPILVRHGDHPRTLNRQDGATDGTQISASRHGQNPTRTAETTRKKERTMPRRPHDEQDWIRSRLFDLCAIDSTSGREGYLRPAIEGILTELQARLQVQTLDPVGSQDLPPRVNILARWGRPRVLLTTHLDTVPPFLPPTADAQRLTGRGSCDAKGQIIAQLAVIRRLLAAGWKDLAWLGVVGEEISSDGAIRASELAEDLPHLEAVINGEPTEGALVSGQKGFLHLRLTAFGERAHSSEPAADPSRGRHALWRLVDWLTALRALPAPGHPKLGGETWNLGLLQGGEAANVVPGTASAEVVVRTVPGSTFAEDVRRLAPPPLDHAPNASRSTVETLLDEPPVLFDPIPGFDAIPVAFGSDTPRFRPLVPTGRLLMLGPGSIRTAHRDDEHLEWRDLDHGIERLESLCLRLLHGSVGGAT